MDNELHLPTTLDRLEKEVTYELAYIINSGRSVEHRLISYLIVLGLIENRTSYIKDKILAQMEGSYDEYFDLFPNIIPRIN